MGIVRMPVDTPVTLGLSGFKNGHTYGSFLWILNNIYFQCFSLLITIVSALVMIGMSLATAAPDYSRIHSLTFGKATEEDVRKTRAGWGWQEVAASAFTLGAILAAYVYFRG